MSLIKCSECNKEVSENALACPHCGNPKLEKQPIIVHAHRSGVRQRVIILFIILIILFTFLVIFVLPKEEYKNQISSFLSDQFLKIKELQTGAGQEKIDRMQEVADKNKIPISKISNLGITFYIGEIEYANTTNITDDLKNRITKILYNAHTPKSVIERTSIIILNNLAMESGQYVDFLDNKMMIPTLNADFLSEGGLYFIYNYNDQEMANSAIIFLNKSAIGGSLIEVLTHEFGHAVSSTLTKQEWVKYYQLRNIPTGTPREGLSWNLSPQEDFAEVYKNVYTNLDIRTYYGILSSGIGDMCCSKIYNKLKYGDGPIFPSFLSLDEDAKKEAKIITNPDLQKCRRNVLMDYSKCDSDFGVIFGAPYKSTVNQATKDFITKVNTD